MQDEQEFQALLTRVAELYREGRFMEALDGVLASADAFPDAEDTMSFWAACLESRVGRPDRAMETLQKAMRRGNWWPPEQLRRDPDLEALRGRQDFQDLVATCERLAREAQAAAKRQLVVHEPPGTVPDGGWPVLVALHGRGETARDSGDYWTSCLAAGILVAMPQSSQVPGPHGFSWDDPRIAEEELADAYADLRGAYRTNAEKLVLAGFSQGGALAISLALRGEPFPSCGFIAVSPSLVMDDDQVQAFLRTVDRRRDVRGFIVSGELDPALEGTQALHREMIRFGIPCELEVRTGLGHAFPRDFPGTLARALQYLLPQP